MIQVQERQDKKALELLILAGQEIFAKNVRPT